MTLDVANAFALPAAQCACPLRCRVLFDAGKSLQPSLFLRAKLTASSLTKLSLALDVERAKKGGIGFGITFMRCWGECVVPSVL